LILFSCKKETSDPAELSDIKKEIPVPIAPSALEGQVVSDTEIKLFWRDNSDNETGFKIQRKTGNGLFTDIATIASNTVSYSDRSGTYVRIGDYVIRGIYDEYYPIKPDIFRESYMELSNQQSNI
jgi:hypothetical protein